jgi:hypothetical protein
MRLYSKELTNRQVTIDDLGGDGLPIVVFFDEEGAAYILQQPAPPMVVDDNLVLVEPFEFPDEATPPGEPARQVVIYPSFAELPKEIEFPVDDEGWAEALNEDYELIRFRPDGFSDVKELDEFLAEEGFRVFLTAADVSLFPVLEVEYDIPDTLALELLSRQGIAEFVVPWRDSLQSPEEEVN